MVRVFSMAVGFPKIAILRFRRHQTAMSALPAWGVKGKLVATVSDFTDRGLLSGPTEEPTVTNAVTVATRLLRLLGRTTSFCATRALA